MYINILLWGFQVALVVKNLSANSGKIRDEASIPVSWKKNVLEKGMAIHSSILAWRILCPEDHIILHFNIIILMNYVCIKSIITQYF